MHLVGMIIFNVRGSPILPAIRGNRWKWFQDRGITLAQMDGSVYSEDTPITVRFSGHYALRGYIVAQGLNPRSIVYVSDQLKALRAVKKVVHTLTLAVPPARARSYTDYASSSAPNTASLAGIINFLDWRFRPVPKLPASTSSIQHGSEK